MVFDRRDFAGAAANTALGSAITNTALSLTLDAAISWPDADQGDFFIVIDPDVSAEEKIRCSAIVGTTITVATGGRGADGTSASAHSAGATVKHVGTALDFDEANYWVAELAGAIGAAGDLPVGDGDNSLTGIAKGANNTALVVNSSGVLGWAAITAAMLAADIATQAELDAVAAAAVNDGDAAGGDLAGTYPDPTLGTGVVDNAHLADGDTVTIAETADEVMSHVATFSRAGTLVTGTGTMRFRFPYDATLVHTRLSVGTAPTGAAVLVDVHLNGTTVYTTQANRPTIAISANAETATTAPDVTAIVAGDYLTVDIDQVGSTIAGAGLVVNVYYVLA